MHTFTKQQRQGGVKYASRTLVGNWSEDLDLQAASLTQFLQKKETGALKVDRYDTCADGLQPRDSSTHNSTAAVQESLAVRPCLLSNLAYYQSMA